MYNNLYVVNVYIYMLYLSPFTEALEPSGECEAYHENQAIGRRCTTAQP